MPDTTSDYCARSVAGSSVAAHHQTASTFAVVLAGGRDSRLKPLTDWRAKPAMPFGSKLKIIDFALSNCINSGVRPRHAGPGSSGTAVPRVVAALSGAPLARRQRQIERCGVCCACRVQVTLAGRPR